MKLLVGNSLGCVDIDIERKNISISGVDIVFQIVRKRFILVYPELLTGSEIYQTKTLQLS